MTPLTLLPRRIARSSDIGVSAAPRDHHHQQSEDLRAQAVASLTPTSRVPDGFVWSTRRKTGAARGDLPPP